MYEEPLNTDIQDTIKKLIEEKDIMSYQNAELTIDKKISEKIIEELQGKWTKEKIHLLLLLGNYCSNFETALTDDNIDLLIKRLIEETNIMSFENAAYSINKKISEKIIKAIKWDEDNIHLLLLLNENCNNFGNALLDNIGLLKKRLIEETDIMSYRNRKYFIPQIVSEKIMETIEWNKDSIHLLLLLYENCDNFGDALAEKNIELLIIRLIEETDIMSYKNVKYFIDQIISEKIIKTIKWNKNNIHLLLLLDPKAKDYTDALTEKNIKLLIIRLIEKTDIMSYKNAKYFIHQTISGKIIKTIEWNKNNIHLLLLLDPKAEFYTDALNQHIGLLIERLIEKTNIMSQQNVTCMPQKISEKIMETIEWNKNNIYLLLLLHPKAEGYTDALIEKNIGLLRERLIEETNIMSQQNVTCMPQKISEKIMKTIEWNKNNIHLLLLLHPKAEGYTDALTEKNIKLLIIRLIEETNIMSYKNLKYFINKTISEKIMKTIEWNKNNMHLLFGVDYSVKTISQINYLTKLQSSLSPWEINKKYMIRRRINYLLQEIDLSGEKETHCDNKEINIEQFKSLDISYSGMCPNGKYSVAIGFCIITTPLLLKKYCKYNIMENKKLFIPAIGIGTLMFVLPIIVNTINKHIDKKNFTKRSGNKEKIIQFLNKDKKISISGE